MIMWLPKITKQNEKKNETWTNKNFNDDDDYGRNNNNNNNRIIIMLIGQCNMFLRKKISFSVELDGNKIRLTVDDGILNWSSPRSQWWTNRQYWCYFQSIRLVVWSRRKNHCWFWNIFQRMSRINHIEPNKLWKSKKKAFQNEWMNIVLFFGLNQI